MLLKLYPPEELISCIGVFETFPVRDGILIHFEEHWERLRGSCNALGFHFPFCFKEVRDDILKLCLGKSNNVRLTYQAEAHELYIQILPLVRRSKIWKLLPVVITPHPMASHKTTDRYMYEENWRKAAQAGASDSLLISTEGEILETTRANFFMVKKGTILTPPCNGKILPGIVRKLVLQAASFLSIPLSEEAIRNEDLCLADEIFASNSLSAIVPVSEIVAVWKTDSFPGPVTGKLMSVVDVQ